MVHVVRVGEGWLCEIQSQLCSDSQTVFESDFNFSRLLGLPKTVTLVKIFSD